MIFVSKFMVHRALSDKTYLLLGLLSPLRQVLLYVVIYHSKAREGSKKTKKNISPSGLELEVLKFSFLECFIYHTVNDKCI